MMNISFTASTAWKPAMPMLIQRWAPFTVRPMPGRNTTSSITKHIASSRWLYFSTILSSMRISAQAMPPPMARNTRWRMTK